MVSSSVPNDNTTEQYTTASEEDGESLSSILPAMLLGLCGLGGNAFVILVVLRFPKLRRRLTSTFLLNQSFADMIASGVMVVHYVTRYLGLFHAFTGGIAGELYCRLWLTSVPLFGAMLASTFNLMSITLERYMMVIHPIYHKNNFNKRKALILIACSWMFGVGYNGFWSVYSTRLYGDDCEVFANWPSVRTAQLYAVLTFLFHFALPVALMGSLYARMVFALRKKSNPNRIDSEINARKQNSEIPRAQKNLIKTLVIVLFGFVVCWTPNQIYWLLFNFGYVSDAVGDTHTVSVIFVYTNCCINPFIYAFKYDEFRRGIRKLFLGKTGNPAAGDQQSKTVSQVVSDKSNNP